MGTVEKEMGVRGMEYGEDWNVKGERRKIEEETAMKVVKYGEESWEI